MRKRLRDDLFDVLAFCARQWRSVPDAVVAVERLVVRLLGDLGGGPVVEPVVQVQVRVERLRADSRLHALGSSAISRALAATARAAPAPASREVAQQLARQRGRLARHPRAGAAQRLLRLRRVRQGRREQCGGQAPVLSARCVDEPAGVARVRPAGRVHQQAEQSLRLRPALHGVLLVDLARVLGHPPYPGVRLIPTAYPLFGECLQHDLHALAALVARPGGHQVDRLVERLGVARGGNLLQRAQAQLRVAIALDGGDQETALEVALAVEVQHRLRAPPAVRRYARARQRGPHVLLGVVEVLDGDPPQLALEDLGAPLRIRRHRQHAPLDAHAPAAAAPDGPDDDRAAAVDVAVEQGMQRDDGVVVLRRRVDEVDDDARLLARMAARHAPYALLVDALGGGRGEVHADRGTGAVPALGEQLRVDQDVDRAALVLGEDPRQLALRRLAGDRLRLQADVPECLRDVVGVPDACRVDDAGYAVEAGSVEIRDREAEGQLIQQLSQHVLVELRVYLAPPEGHFRNRADTGARRNPNAAQRRDHAPPRGLREVEARRLRREQVGHVTGDQRAGRSHADEDRAVPSADRGARLLAEGGVRLVADDDCVGVGDLSGVADEPLVGLDRDRALRVVLASQQRGGDAIAVAALAQLAVELVDEVAAVGQDQDAASARSVDEPERGDRLAGAGRVLEPEALGGVRVLRLLGELDVLVVLGFVLPVLRLLVGLLVLLQLQLELFLARDRRGGELDGHLGGRGLHDCAAVPVRGAALHLRHQRRQRARQRVDLVRVEQRPVGEARLVVRQHALQAEQQRVLAPPGDRRRLQAGVELYERRVERAATGAAGSERVLGQLTLVNESLTGEAFRASERAGIGKGR